jgi:hypothetical protein
MRMTPWQTLSSENAGLMKRYLNFSHSPMDNSGNSAAGCSFEECRMNTSKKLAVLFLLFACSTTSRAFAADDGNTKPRMSTAAVYYTTADIINQTSVSGNVKGVSCHYINGSGANLIFTVNGATAQTIDVSGGVPDVNGETHTGWIPMNIRFTSSIRVQIQHSGGSGYSACTVSWALD